MNRLKLLATATLMALTFTACDEGTPPPVEPPPPPTPVGTISGTVTIEGTAASGITATLSSGATTTTGSGGDFAFSGVEAGTYTVTISGFPEDATFAQVTQSATIATDGQNVQLNFAGEYIRSSAVVGNVVAADAMMSGGDGQPETLAGVTVTLGGEHAMGETMETDMSGGFAFTGLRAGTYTVTISDFPEDVSFEEVSLEISVEVGEVGQADFTGHFIRNSAVEGQVIIEGEGLQGVTVTLAGGPADESYTTMTDTDGMYRFEELRPGDYTVSISDFDTRDYEFAATSQDVSVDLDETGTVSFTGVLLRTSGIAGRVSVEGMGLGGIEVTLSGGEEAQTAMTDDGGQYNFAGLAAGDYTVSISVESDAYVFESMSSDVALGDDESAIVNFEGMHARTASVSGMVFLDEATKNDMHDEGEHPLAHAGIPVALVGPGVTEQRLGATDATGAFSFTGLRAGGYQLVVLIDVTVAAALAANSVAYGGSNTGYEIALGVGEAASQAIPFDITHTMVNFSVSLRHGDEMGAALPDASVTLYGANDAKVGSGMTDDEGSVSIKVARAGTSGNMVKAGVSAEGYNVADGMTDVSWDPQMFTTEAGNSNDIVNLNVSASVSGATVETDYGGGKALAGWAIGVMMGDDAVDGAPEMLDDDGNAKLMTTVSKGDLPATFTFAVADDQDDKMDGGEAYDGTDATHTHTGLALAGTMDAGMIEVAYTTQTLKVYVHEERDQVMGYTGNVLGSDARDDGKVSVKVRRLDDRGRSRSFTKAEWDADKNTKSAEGVHTFSHLPADANVIVNADEVAGHDIMLLDPDELAAWEDMEDNGITGGAFGDMGGFHHTVELCPLKATAPQDFGECASFAYVNTYTVSGLVWKNGVKKDGDDFADVATVFVPGQTVSLSPVPGKNLAGEEESYTTAEKDTRKDKTQGLDATHQFSFSDVAAGVYTLSIPTGWRAMVGEMGEEADKFDNELDPLGGPLSLDVTPATATVYGRVVGGTGAEKGFPLDSVTVTVGDRSAMTDASGRYIVDGITAGKKFVIAASRGASSKKTDSLTFAANTVTRQEDIDLSAASQTASISGTVRASGTNAPVAGAEITVTGSTVTNLKDGKLLTGTDGTYTAIVEALALGGKVSVSVSKKGMTFVPPSIPGLPAHANSALSGIDFTGFVNATITGRVVAPGGGPLAGVTVTATSATDEDDTYQDETGVTGTFSLNVPFGDYILSASKGNYTFDPPSAVTGWVVSTAPGTPAPFGNIQAKTAGALNLAASRIRNEDADDGGFDESQSWSANSSVTYTATAANTPDAYPDATYEVQTSTDDGDTWTAATATAVRNADDTADLPGQFTIPSPTDGAFKVRVIASADETTASTPPAPYGDTSAVVTVVEINPSASGAKAVRGVRDPDGTPADTIGVSWTATTDADSRFRVVIEVNHSAVGNTVWLVAPTDGTVGTAIGTDGTPRAWTLTIPAEDAAASTGWTYVAGGAAAPDVSRADLLKALKIRVDARQDVVDVNDANAAIWPESRQGTPVSVPAKAGS